MRVVQKRLRDFSLRPNNNSADFILPSLVFGCPLKCAYCYMKRWNPDSIQVVTRLDVDRVIEELYHKIYQLPWPKVPNQQDQIYYTIDIGSNTDVAATQGILDWEHIIYLISAHGRAKVTFATKLSHKIELSPYEIMPNTYATPRIRISLMPEAYAAILEPDTTPIPIRIMDITRLQNLGWEVHINLSPVVVMPGGLKLYRDLLERLPKGLSYEVIFMTAHENTNAMANPAQLEFMKRVTEVKNAQGVMRYPIATKRRLVEKLLQVFYEVDPSAKIRYIF